MRARLCRGEWNVGPLFHHFVVHEPNEREYRGNFVSDCLFYLPAYID